MSESIIYPQTANPDIVYPDSDGEPMAESDFQRKPLIYAVSTLAIYFQDKDDIYVSGNMLLYYEEGNPKAVVSPDVFVVKGVAKHDRSSYMLWQEKKAPDFVLEITSKSTVSNDQGVKRGLYAFLGVQEYFQYDPTADYLDPPLQGLRLVEDNYLPIPLTESAGILTIHSQVLGLDIQLQDNEFHFIEPDSGKKLLWHEEAEAARAAAEAARIAAEERIAAEVAAREAAEARIAELEAQLKQAQSTKDGS